MSGAGLTAWLGCGAVLAALLAVEVQTLTDDPELELRPSAAIVPGAASNDVPARAPVPPLEAVLARPLFTRGRRPEPRPELAVAAAPSLPRLAGILVNGADRSAILVPAQGGAGVVAREGMAVDGLTVRRIQAGEVTVSAPDGERVLRPSFDRRRAAPPQREAIPATTSPFTGPFTGPSAAAAPAEPAMGPPGGLAR